MKTFQHYPYDVANIPIGGEIYNVSQNKKGIVIRRYTCECWNHIREHAPPWCSDCAVRGQAYWVRREDGLEVGWCYGLWRDFQ